MHNHKRHIIIMLLLCAVPVALAIFLSGRIGGFGRWLGPLAMLVCIGSHIWMMKSMHHNGHKHSDQTKQD
jgi:hypothetical protein